MNIKFYLSFILIVLGVNLQSQGQISYNKRAMGAVGNAPKVADYLNDASLDNVDMSTGTLKVGIPLYEIKVNDITVPISINYTALGLKVGQEAGAPGMGWELNAGGKIITNLQGKADFGGGMNSSNGIPFDINANPSIYDPFNQHKSYTRDVVEGKTDAAWDTYSYSLPTGAGTYTQNGLTFPYDPLLTIDHPNKKIKTTDGIVYSFSSGDYKQSKRRSYYSNQPQPMYIGDPNFAADPQTSTWFDYDLSQIVSAKFKDTVKFEYESIMDTARLSKKTRISTSESIPFNRQISPSGLWGGAYEDPNSKYYRIGEPLISQSKTEYLAHTRIKAITYPNGRVAFAYGDNDIMGRDLLTTVRIYQVVNGVTITLKRYEFEYDETDVTYGLYLKAIHIYDGNDVKMNYWGFTYNGKMPVAQNVQSKAQDRWGFYNGKIQNKTLLEHPDSVYALRVKKHYPIAESMYNLWSKYIRYSRQEAIAYYGMNSGNIVNGVMTYMIDFADRQFLFNEALKGTLTKIKTPSGSTVTYEYEPHKYYFTDYPNNSYTTKYAAGGGIRIKSITKSTGKFVLYQSYLGGTVSKKRFVYGEGSYWGYGGPIEASGYGNVTIPGSVIKTIATYYNSSGNSFTDYNNLMLLSHPVNNLTQYAGSYGMYNVVTEYTEEGDAGLNYGKTVYYNNVALFEKAPDRPWQPNGYETMEDIGVPSSPVNPGVQKEQIIGVMGIKKYAFNKNTAEYKLIEDTKYDFKSFSAPLNAQTKFISFFCALGGQLSGPLPSYTADATCYDLPVANPDAQSQYLYNQLGGGMDYFTRANITGEGNTPNYPGKYAYSFVDLATLANCIKKEKETVTLYSESGYNTVETKYYYDNPDHLLATRITSMNSKGDSTINHIKYPLDYPSASYPLSFLKNNRLSLSEPVEEVSTYKIGATQYVKQGTVNMFKVENDIVYNDRVYSLKIPGSVVYNGGLYYNSSTNTVDNNLFKQQVSYDSYVKGNVTRYTESNGSSTGFIWGHNNQYAIAKINNVSAGGYNPNDDASFTNFESGDKGNWTYAGVPLSDLLSPFGKKVYALTSGAITKTSATSAGKYILSYWYKNGATVNVSGATVGAAVIKNTRADWTLAEREITYTSGTLTISGTGNIDELRLHPFDAQMTTYTYDPLIGLKSTIDPKGKIQYYEYDDFQRLKLIRDQDGNIVKGYRYYKGTSNN
ncbi:hypothetical protein [Pedobacter ginsengisoli]|uniref:hypothetical protein n=1 Tax=Pedobacter ginsengisoli TaxID=363852 RepID=UPI002549C763|nr:hypothetical protein [Pedobacter ginsengisoli]